MAPFVPFTAEYIYKSLNNEKESVHLEKWPAVLTKRIKPELEKEMSELRDIAAKGLALRKARNIKVRQPLTALIIKKALPDDLLYLLRDEVNVKQIAVDPTQKDEVVLDTKITPALKAEGGAREIARQIQEMRKSAGYPVDLPVRGYWKSDSESVKKIVDLHGQGIAKDTALSSFELVPQWKGSYDVKRTFELSPQTTIELGLKK